MSDTTRWTLIHGAAKGKPLDRAEFARRYASVIRSYLRARWIRGPLRNEIDDAAQDVFVDCFKENGALSRADPEHAGGFRAFLYGVVRNVALRFEEKRAGRREVSPPSGVEIESDDESLGRVFDRAWAKAILKQAAAVQAKRGEAEGDLHSFGAPQRESFLRVIAVFDYGVPKEAALGPFMSVDEVTATFRIND